MKYKSSNRGDRTRFPLPVPIDDGSRLCVKVYVPNIPGHRQAFQGAIYNLSRWYSWTLEPTKKARIAAAVWNDIYDQMMTTFYDGCPDDKPCFEFTPAAGFIEWFPNNPYTTPDLVGAGYNAPAWYRATTASNLLLGTQFGDIVTDLSRFPPGSLPSIIPASGLPRFRLTVMGEGRVTLHLLNIIAGSLAQITVDNDIGTIRFIDSARDQLAAPFETATTTPIILDIVGAGLHVIDVIIVSQLNDQIPFLHHGGGLRSVELCGFESMVTMANPIFRFTETCVLELSYNGVDYVPVAGWTEFANACFAGPDGAPGAPGADGAPGAPGADGMDGAPGAPGATGLPGAPGAAGADGVDGADGAPGAPGADGAAGADGADGVNGADGNQGVPGVDGADGRTALRCMSANAFMNGIYLEFLQNMVLFSYTDMLFSYNFVPRPTDENVIDQALTSIFFNNQFPTFIQNTESIADLRIILQTMYDLIKASDGSYDLIPPFAEIRLDGNLTQGFYCWLCDNGAYDVSRLDDLLYAITVVAPNSFMMAIWGQWLKLFFDHQAEAIRNFHAKWLFDDTCSDASCDDCSEWDQALNGWTKQHDLNVTAGEWVGNQAFGELETVWTAGEGMQPDLTTSPGSGNWSCIMMRMFTGSHLFTQLAVGLASGYLVPGHFNVIARKPNNLGADVIADFDFPAGQDYFGAVFESTIEYDQITVRITRQDNECFDQLEVTPTIRYTVLSGIKPEPIWI